MRLPNPIQELADDGSGGSIMVVDDDPGVTRILRSMLEVDRHQVVELNAADELVERIRDRSPDIVLLDLHMPRVGGATVLEQLRADCGRVAVIILTGDSDAPRREQMLAAGAFEYLIKPVRMDQLRGTVRLSLRLLRCLRANDALRRAMPPSAAGCSTVSDIAEGTG